MEKIKEHKGISWKRGLIALIGLILCCLFATSCTHTKNLQKKSTETKSDSIVNTISVTSTTETTDGTLTVKGDTIEGSEDASDLIEHPIDIEDGDLHLNVTEDKITHRITAKSIQKPKVIPVEIKHVTTNTLVTATEVKRDEKIEIKDVHKEVKGVNWTVIIGIPVTIITLMFFFVIWRKRKQAKEIIDKI